MNIEKRQRVRVRTQTISKMQNKTLLWVLSPKPADYTVVDYKDGREDDLYM